MIGLVPAFADAIAPMKESRLPSRRHLGMGVDRDGLRGQSRSGIVPAYSLTHTHPPAGFMRRGLAAHSGRLAGWLAEIDEFFLPQRYPSPAWRPVSLTGRRATAKQDWVQGLCNSKKRYAVAGCSRSCSGHLWAR